MVYVCMYSSCMGAHLPLPSVTQQYACWFLNTRPCPCFPTHLHPHPHTYTHTTITHPPITHTTYHHIHLLQVPVLHPCQLAQADPLSLT